MTDNDSQQPPQGSYGGPPPTQQFGAQPGYPQPGYPQPGYPAQPGYPHPYGYPAYPYGQQPGYPAYGPPQQLGPRRPGLVIAASVLAYVNAGMIILAGALLLFGAAIVDDFESSAGTGTDYGTEVALLGVANLIAAGLLIAGAVIFTGGKSTGRTMLSVGNGIVIALTVYWLVRFSDDRFRNAGDGFIVWGVIFAALAILPLAFSFTGQINQWLNQSRARNG